MRSIRRIILALSLALTTVIGGATVTPCAVSAQAGCSEGCRAAFGACYKATANRAACEAQLQRCLQGCIQSRR